MVCNCLSDNSDSTLNWVSYQQNEEPKAFGIEETVAMSHRTFHLHLTETEFQSRCDRLLAHLQANALSGVVLFTTDYVLYYTGFAFIPTERPIGFVMNSKGERGMFVPRMEVEHARANALIDRVDHYTEFP